MIIVVIRLLLGVLLPPLIGSLLFPISICVVTEGDYCTGYNLSFLLTYAAASMIFTIPALFFSIITEIIGRSRLYKASKTNMIFVFSTTYCGLAGLFINQYLAALGLLVGAIVGSILTLFHVTKIDKHPNPKF